MGKRPNHPEEVREGLAATVSVIIPTHNRRELLLECLDALAVQDYPMGQLEVVVVADGCRDDTEVAVAARSLPFQLRLISQPASGASAARNRGAEAASAPLLIFLDDDVIASGSLVAAHVRAHAGGGRTVGVGPYQLDPPAPGDLLAEQLRAYWDRKLSRMAAPGYQAGYRDIVTGNLSIARETFASLGGFDRHFMRMEDYEFGARLLASGVRFNFVADARARHLVDTRVAPSLQLTRRTARYEVLLIERHPSLLDESPLNAPPPLAERLVFGLPRLGSASAHAAAWVLFAAQRCRLRSLWRPLYQRLHTYWFWRGIADEVGDLENLSLRCSHARGRGLADQRAPTHRPSP